MVDLVSPQEDLQISKEIRRCRRELGLSQPGLSRLLNMKVHRLADLEYSRSRPNPNEDARIRRVLSELMRARANSAAVPANS